MIPEASRLPLASRRIAPAVLWRAAYLVSQGGLSLVLFAALAQILPASQFAAVAVALGVVVLAQALGDFGLSQAAVTALPSRLAAARAEQRPALIGGAARCFVLAGGAALILCCISAVAVSGDARTAMLLVAPAAAFAVIVSGADGLLRAQGHFGRPVGLVTLSRVGSFAGLLSWSSGSAAVAAALISAGTLVGSLPAMVVVLGSARAGRPAETRAFAKAAVPLGMSQLLVVVSGRGNTLVLSAAAGVRAGAAFEAAWRLFQLGQYAVGAIATGASPIIAAQWGAGQLAELRRTVVRLTVGVGVGGLVIGALLAIAREPLSDLVAGDLGHTVSGAVAPLVLVTPLAFLGFAATIVLAASDRTRRLILPSYALGAVTNGVLIVIALPQLDARTTAIAAAAGTSVTSLLMFGALLHTLRSPLSRPSHGDGADIEVRSDHQAAT